MAEEGCPSCGSLFFDHGVIVHKAGCREAGHGPPARPAGLGGCYGHGEHKLVYAGVRYAEGAWNIPGGGARRRYYAHVYFCERCAEERGRPIAGIEDNSYFLPRFGATPGDPDVVGVPESDREGLRR